MKHAMIMTLNNNIEILRLFIELYDDERYDFFILIDKKSPITNDEILEKIPKKSKVIFPPRINIFWGGYSQIDAYLQLLDISSKGNYDYYHFFQGSDFPIKTKNETDDFFKKNNGKEFINICKNNFAYYKCCYYHFFVEHKSYRKGVVFKVLNHSLVGIQKALKLYRNKGMELYHGSALSSLTHECVTYILQHRDEIRKAFKFSLGGDEVFLQSMIANSPYRHNIFRFENSSEANCRYIDWKQREGNSPYTFLVKDYNELIDSGEGVCFCRKVTEERSMDLVKKIYTYLKNKSESDN